MTHQSEAIVLSCSQCPSGYYVVPSRTTHGAIVGLVRCPECGHEISPGLDIVPYLDDGEILTWASGRLAYLPATYAPDEEDDDDDE